MYFFVRNRDFSFFRLPSGMALKRSTYVLAWLRFLLDSVRSVCAYGFGEKLLEICVRDNFSLTLSAGSSQMATRKKARISARWASNTSAAYRSLSSGRCRLSDMLSLHFCRMTVAFPGKRKRKKKGKGKETVKDGTSGVHIVSQDQHIGTSSRWTRSTMWHARLERLSPNGGGGIMEGLRHAESCSRMTVTVFGANKNSQHKRTGTQGTNHMHTVKSISTTWHASPKRVLCT